MARRRAFLGRLGAAVAAAVAVPTAEAQARKPPKKKRPAASSTRKPKPAAPAPAAVKPAPRKPPAPAVRVAQDGWPPAEPGARIDLAPARWIWLPCERTLANTFVLFRREVEVQGEVASARGWVTADSRYRLFVNGRRVQWGPAPCDPRCLRGRPDRPHAVARPRPERDRGRGPLLRPRRGHVAVREARLPLRAARGGDGRAGDRGGLGRLLARPPRSRAPAGAVQALVPARAAGGLRRAPAARGLERPGRGARRGLDGAAGPGGGGRSPRRRRQPLRVPDGRRHRRGRGGAPRSRGAARPRDVPVRGPPRPLGRGSMAPRPARLVRVPGPGLVRDRGPGGGDALGGGLVDPGAASRRGCLRHLRAAGADGRLPVPDRGGPGRHRGRGDDPGVARPRGPPLARHPPLQLDAVRLPRGREPPGELRLRVPALSAGARARGERGGRPARRRRPPPELPLAQGPELRLPGAEAAARLRGLVQHAGQRRAGDDRGRHGPRAPAVQRRRGPPPARHPPRVRRPAALAALPPAVPDGADAGRLLPRLLAGIRPPEPRRPAPGGGDASGAAPRPRGDARLRRWRHHRETGETDLLLDLYPRFVRFADFLLRGGARTASCPSRARAFPRSGSTTASPGRVTSSAPSTCSPRPS